MARSKADTWYPVPRVVDGLGQPAKGIYQEMCRKSSYDNDNYNAGLPVYDITISQLVVSYKWVEGVFSPMITLSNSQAKTAIKKLVKVGAIEKICDEGFLGMRLFLPHQWDIRWPVYLKKQIKMLEEAQKKLPAKESQAISRTVAIISQAISRHIARVNVATATVDGLYVAGESQAIRRLIAGESQAIRYNTNKEELRTNNKESILDDDDEQSEAFKELKAEFRDRDFEEVNAEQEYYLDFVKRVEAWYLSHTFTADKWSHANKLLLEQWMEKFEGYGFNLSDVSEAFSLVEGRVAESDPGKKIRSLAYFEDEVFRAIKNRIDSK